MDNSYDAALLFAIKRYGEDWQRLARIVFDEIDGWHIREGGPLYVDVRLHADGTPRIGGR